MHSPCLSRLTDRLTWQNIRSLAFCATSEDARIFNQHSKQQGRMYESNTTRDGLTGLNWKAEEGCVGENMSRFFPRRSEDK